MSACRRHYPGRTDGTDSLIPFHQPRPSPDYRWVGSRIISFEACSAFTHVTTCRLTKSPYATLYTGGSDGFVASTAAPIATGWSDPVPGRVSHPAVDQRLFTAHRNRLISTVEPWESYNRCAKNGFIASDAHKSRRSPPETSSLRERFFVGCGIRSSSGDIMYLSWFPLSPLSGSLN
jgi:hypothetical protein